MALTQAQWFSKLRGFVPAWYFEREDLQGAHFHALAKLLADAQTEAESQCSQTFIMQSTDETLDLHGEERNVDRLEGEEDGPFRPRVQSLANQSNIPALKALVDAILIFGECDIVEDYEVSMFLNRGTHLNRKQLFIQALYNTFTILLEKQVHPPYSFFSRENFAGRGDFVGSDDVSKSLFDSIVAAVDRAKAFGTFYRIVERAGA